MFKRGLALLVLVAALVAGYVCYSRWSRDYTVSREEDGSAVTRIVAAAFSGASALKVGSLSGIVQSVASDTRVLGMLHSDQVMKAPFSVDYFIDASRLRPGDVKWNARDKRLTVNVPDVTVAEPNVDEAHRTLVSTRGVFITRTAAEEMSRKISLNARQQALGEARKPQHLMAARENARSALKKLLALPLAAAGLDPQSVRIVFPDERNRVDERWDASRPLDEVLKDAK